MGDWFQDVQRFNLLRGCAEVCSGSVVFEFVVFVCVVVHDVADDRVCIVAC